MNFREKRFLITQPMIHGLAGSTMATLELAEYLQSQGTQVSVYTYFYDFPAREFFEQKKIDVKTFADNPEYSLRDFDYIWVHSQVLPVAIIRGLARKLPAKMPKFIFFHMSKFDWIPDEMPYIWDLEEKISAQSFAISDEIIQETKACYNADFSLKLLRNFAPANFAKFKYSPRQNLRKILIASNHPPEEILALREILAGKNIKTVLLGETGEEYKIITPEFLASFDAVVTIGKTVQYCLAMNVPVYVYDWFGGGGYLNDENFAGMRERNFSGRDQPERQSAEFLANDIISRYTEAVKYQTKNHAKFVREFSIDQVLPEIFADIKSRKIEQFDKKYLNMVINVQRLAQIRFEFGGHLWNRDREIRSLRKEINEMRGVFDSSENLTRENDRLKNQLRKLENSKSFKLGQVIIKPAHCAKRIVKKILHQ